MFKRKSGNKKDVLDFVNEIRIAHDTEPIEKLECHGPRYTSEDTINNSIEQDSLIVSATHHEEVTVYHRGRVFQYPFPAKVRNFIKKFNRKRCS